MQRPYDVEFMETFDGSHTLRLVGVDEQYHSCNGALQESQHVFIQAGLHAVVPGNNPLYILEVGLGTGLNALLTAMESPKLNRKVYYHALEPFPLKPQIIQALNYPGLFSQKRVSEIFHAIHTAPDHGFQSLGDGFFMKRSLIRVQEFLRDDNPFDLVYFDAFGPDTQPEMWIPEVFEQIARSMGLNGILVTYCAKGEVRRAMKSAGFRVERLPGPPGKREMTRAEKI